ncbi:Gem (Nuclear organelle) associated protein 6 [Actinomortierella ambigua]|uniref:Gem (Nuclear organelle) associated protein 6 n=1 Tax=Actinomortierella ambigua TaxID=1343610 RepID=A0A9P6QIX7_9FUNG|nr:Gem (Nuclear organelle) associated protein 6 [Actinomortierella ambigua]
MSTKIHGYHLKEIYRGLGAPCRIEALKGKVYEGHLHAIDPQTHTVLLIQLPNSNSDSQVELIAVRRDAITKVTIDFDSKDRISTEAMDRFMCSPPQLGMIDNPELAQERRAKLVQLFESHRIPVDINQGDDITTIIRIMGVVTIQPPYDVASIDAPSAVVRDRVRDMVHGWVQQGLF